MDQVPNSRDIPAKLAETSKREQKWLATGSYGSDRTEIYECDSTEPPCAPVDRESNISDDLSSSSEIFYDACTGSDDIAEFYKSSHSTTYGAVGGVISMSKIESGRSISLKVGDTRSMPSGRQQAAIRPIILNPDRSPTSPSSDQFNTEVKQVISTSGPEVESGARTYHNLLDLESDLSLTSASSDQSNTEVKQVISTSRSEEGSSASTQDNLSVDGKVPLGTLSIQEQEFVMLLIGKTGHGKSATGNSILGRDKFRSSSNSSSVTRDVSVAWTKINDCIIKVVDGPGFADTDDECGGGTQKACDDMDKAMTLCYEGFHALLLVLKYGERFTKEEQNCIAMLKSIFGKNIIRDYCVIVVTHGELFDLDDEYAEFADWLENQEGPQKKLFIECSYRCVLMRNKTKDENTKKTQLNELLQAINTMKYRETRYTNELFAEVQNERKRLVVDAKAPFLKQEIMRDINLIVSDLNKLKKKNDDVDETDAILLQLEKRASGLDVKISNEDNGTGVFNELKNTVDDIQQTLQTEKAINTQKKKDLKILDQLSVEHAIKFEELKLQHTEEKRKLMKQYKNANEADRENLKRDLQAIIQRHETEKTDLTSIHEQHLQQAKLEAQNLQTRLDQSKREHTEQMHALQKQCKDWETTNAEVMKTSKVISDKLEKMEMTRAPPKDPTKVTLHCMDQDGCYVTVPIPKKKSIRPLIDAYCGISGHSMDAIKLFFGDRRVYPNSTPNDSELQLEEDDLITVFLKVSSG